MPMCLVRVRRLDLDLRVVRHDRHQRVGGAADTADGVELGGEALAQFLGLGGIVDHVTIGLLRPSFRFRTCEQA